MQIISKSIVAPDGAVEFDVTFNGDKGEVIHRIVPFDTYLDMLKANRTEKKERFMEVPILPKEIVSCKIDTETEGSFDCTVVLPAKKRSYSYYDNCYQVPFPALVAYISVRKGRRTNTYLFASATDNPKKGDTLYEYPFGNCGANGSCCYGNIAAGANGPDGAIEILNLFLEGNSNNDLYHKQNTENLSLMDLIKRIKPLDVYPGDLLKKSNKTF